MFFANTFEFTDVFHFEKRCIKYLAPSLICIHAVEHCIDRTANPRKRRQFAIFVIADFLKWSADARQHSSEDIHFVLEMPIHRATRGASALCNFVERRACHAFFKKNFFRCIQQLGARLVRFCLCAPGHALLVRSYSALPQCHSAGNERFNKYALLYISACMYNYRAIFRELKIAIH